MVVLYTGPQSACAEFDMHESNVETTERGECVRSRRCPETLGLAPMGPSNAYVLGLIPTQVIGWTSSALLLVTIAQQVWKQWKEGSSEGISPWLFIGQVAASVGFTIYSLLQRDWVFVSTNAMMVANALVGWLILRRNRRRQRRA